MLDVGSHILYSPLPCQTPLPGLEGYRFCVSRYDSKEKQLLRNLCYVLGVKFTERFSKKATHIFCKFADGEKYETASRLGMQVVTAEWIYECVKQVRTRLLFQIFISLVLCVKKFHQLEIPFMLRQNKVVDLKGFYPKDLTSEDRDRGLCSFSQYPTQSIQMTSGDDAVNCSSQSQGLSNMQTVASIGSVERDQDKSASSLSKRAKLSVEHPQKYESSEENSVNRTKIPLEDNATEKLVSSFVPDVASAIEDLLAQTSKVSSSTLFFM